MAMTNKTMPQSHRVYVCRQMSASSAESGPSSAESGPGVRGQRDSMAAYCSELRLWMARVQQTRCMEAMFPIWLSQQLAAGSLPQPQQQVKDRVLL